MINGAAVLWNKLAFWRYGVVFFALTLPFSFWRHIRVHGDEKVYVAQALEMLRAGHFWQQLQFGDINYIKGPSHYILLIIGHHLFGFSPLSVVYMNLLIGAVAVSVLRAASEHLLSGERQLKGLPAWLFATSGAFIMFTYSSQMDSALTSLYAIAISLSVLARFTGRDFYYLSLWLVIGFAGTLKSPLHSCLLGVSVLVYFFAGKSLFTELFSSKKRLLFLLAGIFLGGIGYVLPFLLDRDNWLQTFIFREQLNRPRFSDSGIVFLLNNFVINLLPWSFLLLYCVVLAVRRLRSRSIGIDPVTSVSLAFILPTFLFFFGLGYRAPWYGLPMIAPVALLIVAQLRTTQFPLRKVAISVMPLSVLMTGVVLICHLAFYKGTPWWTLTTTFASLALFTLSFFFLDSVYAGSKRIRSEIALIFGLACFWYGSLSLTAALGESELSDARELLHQNSAPLNYDNTKKENFNEWGMMAYMLGRPTYFSNTYEELLNAGSKGQWLVFTSQQDLDSFWGWLELNHPVSLNALRPQVNVWRRWPRNIGQLRDIWTSRESTENIWDKVTRHFILVRFAATQSVFKGASIATGD
jgi:4-amino-4-deoxy-L-arabinose transferase-like glycosyltransferase